MVKGLAFLIQIINQSIYKVIKEKDIVIFGKNSIIAKNFSRNFHNSKNQIISITRSPSSDKDIICSLDQEISPEDLDNICAKIDENSNYIDKIFILFAWIGRPRANSPYDETWDKNKKIILNFLEICQKLNPSKIIFLSSTSLYPENSENYFCELDQTNPNTPYSKQKLIAEKQIKNFAHDQNIELSILRISSAYGFDNRFSEQGVINKWLYDAIKFGKINLLNSKESIINFISFDQISNAIISSITQSLDGTYNIASQESISLKNIILEIERITKKKLKLHIINEKKRTININTNKFYKATGVKFENAVIRNIESIYSTILKELN